MKTSTSKLTLSILTAAALTNAATSQLSLPRNQTSAVRYHIGQGNLKQTIRTALNTPGDTITLDLFAEVSGMLLPYLKGGIYNKFEVEVARTDKGYEVGLSLDQAASVGVSALANVEANVEVGRGGKVLFGFDSDEKASRGMRLLAIARMLRLDRALKAGTQVLRTAQSAVNNANRAVWSAVQKRQIAQRVEKSMKRSYEIANSFLTTFYKPLANARARVRTAQKRVDDLARKLATMRVGRGKLLTKAAYRTAKAFVDSLRRSLSRIEADYRSAMQRMQSKRSTWYAKAAEVRRLIQTEAQKRKQQTWAMAAYKKAQATYAMLTNPAQQTSNLRSAVELKAHIGANGSISLGTPGVTLGNLGLSAGVAANAGLSMRWDFSSSKNEPTRITIGADLDVSITGSAGAGLGADVAVSNSLRVESSFYRYGNRGRFQRSGLKAIATVDVSLTGVAGIGLMRVQGIGHTMRLEMPAAQWNHVRTRFENRRRSNRNANLTDDLHAATGTYTEQSRWILGGRFGFGVDLAIVSFEIGGGAVWADRGTERKTNVTNSSYIRRMRTKNHLKGVANNMRRFR